MEDCQRQLINNEMKQLAATTRTEPGVIIKETLGKHSHATRNNLASKAAQKKMNIGEVPSSRKKKYIERDNRIFNATLSFDNMRLIPFLDNVMGL